MFVLRKIHFKQMKINAVCDVKVKIIAVCTQLKQLRKKQA